MNVPPVIVVDPVPYAPPPSPAPPVPAEPNSTWHPSPPAAVLLCTVSLLAERLPCTYNPPPSASPPRPLTSPSVNADPPAAALEEIVLPLIVKPALRTPAPIALPPLP